LSAFGLAKRRDIRRDRTLDHHPRCHDFKRTFAELGSGRQVRARTGRCWRADIDARTHPDLDAPFQFQCYQRLSHRRPRHPEHQRQFALGRQAAVRREALFFYQRPQFICDLKVETTRLDGFDSHEGSFLGVLAVSAERLNSKQRWCRRSGQTRSREQLA
jgi:hypothetical protein